MVFALGTDAFLSEANILNLLRQIAPLLIVGVAMTFVITTGGIDLSVGSIWRSSTRWSAIFLQAGLPWPAGRRRCMLLLRRRWSALVQGFVHRLSRASPPSS